MWRPTSEQEIVAAIEAGHLIENASFDAKAALPIKLAITADGGKRMNVKAPRLACMSIAMSRLSVCSRPTP